MAERDIGKAQACPCLKHVLAIDDVVPAAGSIVTTSATGAPALVTQAALGASLVLGLTATKTQDVGSIGAGAVATFDVTVTGAVAGQCVVVSPPAALDAGLVCFGLVSAANTVTVRVFNGTAAAIDPAEGVFRVRVLPN